MIRGNPLRSGDRQIVAAVVQGGRYVCWRVRILLGLSGGGQEWAESGGVNGAVRGVYQRFLSKFRHLADGKGFVEWLTNCCRMMN